MICTAKLGGKLPVQLATKSKRTKTFLKQNWNERNGTCTAV